MRSALIFILGGVVGFAIAFMIGTPSKDQSSESVQQILDTHSKLKSLSEHEYQDYLALKDDAEKYKKADELLGKVMVLFLADLSLKLQNSPNENHNIKPEPSPTNETVTPQIQTSLAASQQSQPSQVAEVAWKSNDLKIMSSTTEREVADQLAKSEIKDLKTELRAAVPITQKQLDVINGKYEGVITFFEVNNKPWRVDWEIEGQMVNGHAEGKNWITLANDKKVFSRSRGDGKFKNFEAFSGGTQAILVNAYGDDGYMQLYPVEGMNKLVGNFYLITDKKNDQFNRAGIVSLTKVK